MTEGLFAEPDLEPVPLPGGPFAGVAIEQGIDRVLDYSIPAKLLPELKVGQRVRVPLGRKNRPTHGYVVRITDTTTHPKTKPVIDIDDPRVLIQPAMMELARWISRYYVSPLGMVLDCIIPSAVKNRTGLGYTHQVRPALSREKLQEALEQSTRSVKRRTILARLLQVEEGKSIELHSLAMESEVSTATVRKLATLGLVTITEEADMGSLALDAPVSVPDTPPAMNEDQQKVFDDLSPRLAGGFSVNLLHGVTGSGKTEVYLRCIEKVVAAGKQAIVLVPEIALTPQTVRRFTGRFSNVAVIHSALTNTERHQFWQQIATNRAQVIVGARSGIFAPTVNCGIIVVDEEHEPSYKQDTLPRYHARDVAIKRGQLENIPVLLGSATPSLEMWHRVHGANAKGVYHLLDMPRRVRGLQLPKVELVDLAEVARLRKGIHLLSPRLEFLLKQTVDAKQQAILLLNRRGYANFIYCNSCQEAIKCKYCDATMTYHRSASVKADASTTDASLHKGQMHCHYCLAVNTLPATCPTCGKKLSLFGLGTQRVEEELAKKFPHVRFARVDSDTMRSKKDYENLLARFGRGEVDVMLGTQMIAKGLDYPNVTLVGVISGDTALALPDFRAAERTFQLITQVAGRAGRGDVPGKVVLQTFLPDDATLGAAIKQDFVGFANHELAQREKVGLPPYGRMVRLILREQELDDLHRRSSELAEEIYEVQTRLNLPLVIKGPMPCAIERIAGYHRAQIILEAKSPMALQQLLGDMRHNTGLVSNDRLAIDVDPISAL